MGIAKAYEDLLARQVTQTRRPRRSMPLPASASQPFRSLDWAIGVAYEHLQELGEDWQEQAQELVDQFWHEDKVVLLSGLRTLLVCAGVSPRRMRHFDR